MKLEVLSEEKIKIQFERRELESEQISFASLSYKNKKTRDFFKKAIDMAKLQIGFDADDSKLLVEAFPEKNGGISLYVTKLFIKRDEDYLLYEDTEYENTICFDDCDSVFLCADALKNCELNISESSLYYYNNKYYLTFVSNVKYKSQLSLLSSFIYSLSEFGTKDNDTTDSFLNEHAKVIASKNAIQSISK